MDVNTSQQVAVGSARSDIVSGAHQIDTAAAEHQNSDRQRPLSKVDNWVRRSLEDPKNRLALSALSRGNPASLLEAPNPASEEKLRFNTQIPFDVRSSGCDWLSAALNVYRVAMIRKYNLKSFEFSQAYYLFWDMVGKANCFIMNVLATAEEPLDSRIVSYLMSSPLSNKGQWEMIANLIVKYGIVPQFLYKDSWNAKNSSVIRRLLTAKLREGGLRMRSLKVSGAASDAIQSAKEEIMEAVVRTLTIALGPVPPAHDRFTWEFYNKSEELKRLRLSPFELAASLDETQVLNLLSLVHDPRDEYYKLLTVDRLRNMWAGQPVYHINVDIETIKTACIAMLREGSPVFVGCDVDALDGTGNIADSVPFDAELGFNIKIELTKANRLFTGESRMTHASILTAVHLDDTHKPVRWRFQNTRALTHDSSSFVVTDSWMNEYCYQAVVDPAVVSPKVKDVLKQEAIVLDPWDPIGSLA